MTGPAKTGHMYCMHACWLVVSSLNNLIVATLYHSGMAQMAVTHSAYIHSSRSISYIDNDRDGSAKVSRPGCLSQEPLVYS